MKELKKREIWLCLLIIIIISIGIISLLILVVVKPSILLSPGESNLPGSGPVTINDTSVKSITLVFNQGNDSIAVNKSNNNVWVFTNKPDLIAPELVIQSIFLQLRNLETCQKLVDFNPENWLELTNLTAEISILNNSNEETSIKIGEPKAVDFSYYVNLDSVEILVCPFDQTVGLLNTFYFELLPIYIEGTRNSEISTPTPN